MESTFLNLIGSAATVALIVIATRWISGAKGAQIPITRNGTSQFAIKWQFRAVSFIGEGFFILLLVLSLYRPHMRYLPVVIVSAIGIPMSMWLASGAVTTTQSGISKRILWHNQSFQWNEITEIRFHTKQGGAIELRGGSRKLVIDYRVVAFQYLLDEIKDKTKLRPLMD